MVAPTIGVLALQGAFAKHIAVLRRLNVASKEVRYPEELHRCEALIIPGGESTTITDLVDFSGMRQPLLAFARRKPVMGTCAGLILMANKVDDSRVETLNLLNIDVVRNFYGRQVDSFAAPIDVSLEGETVSIKGVFIRAPKITSVGEETEVLGVLNGDPVLVREKSLLGITFHPELSDSAHIHRYFVSMVTEKEIVQ